MAVGDIAAKLAPIGRIRMLRSRLEALYMLGTAFFPTHASSDEMSGSMTIEMAIQKMARSVACTCGRRLCIPSLSVGSLCTLVFYSRLLHSIVYRS